MTERTPARIWLLLGEGDEGSHIWSDDPNPTGSGEHDAVEYVRADGVGQAVAAAVAVERERAALVAFLVVEEHDVEDAIAKAIGEAIFSGRQP